MFSQFALIQFAHQINTMARTDSILSAGDRSERWRAPVPASLFHTWWPERRSLTGLPASKRSKPVRDWRSSLSAVRAACEICRRALGTGRRFGCAPLCVGFLLGLWAAVSDASAQNLAQNPGFESGDTSGWFAFGSATISVQGSEVHSGSHAALVTDRSATWHGIAQSLEGILEDGQTYDLSVWVRLVSGGSQSVQLTMKKTDGNGDAYAAIASGTATASGWIALDGQYTLNVSGTLSQLTLYIEIPGSDTAACYADDLTVESSDPGAPGIDGESTVLWDDVRQRIDGFGASSAWRSSWANWQGEMFFSTNSGTGYSRTGTPFPFNGVGLSLLRTRIVPGGTTWEQSIMQMAQARGARVWSAPWSPAPAAQFKSNTNVNGGSFIGNAATYQAYANQLAGYVVNMKNQYGVNLYALSVQNEPDADVTTYESCNWTAQQIHDFIPYLASALAASNVGATRIMLPESQNWTDPQGLRLTTMNDPVTEALVGIIANHNYVPNNAIGDQSVPAAVNSHGKALWETEVAKLSGNDSSISDGLYWAGRVHQFLTVAQANAWHYWWLCAHGSGNQGLCDTNDVPAKRMYTLGNFSRFVRPGYHRIETTNTGSSRVSAYRDLTNGTFAVVAINAATHAVTQTFHLNGFTAASVRPWLTSATLSLAAGSQIGVTNAAFTWVLPAMSVVTFTGQATASNSPPTLMPVGDQTIDAGMTCVVTNRATDPDLPGQTLTYTLLSGPTHSTLDTSSGVFSWRPPVTEANTTNAVRVQVSDDGSPVLSATTAFSVIVNPLTPATIDSVRVDGSRVDLFLSGPTGPDYTVLSSSNLADWQPLLTTNPAALPLTLLFTNTVPQRFYRLQLGP